MSNRGRGALRFAPERDVRFSDHVQIRKQTVDSKILELASAVSLRFFIFKLCEGVRHTGILVYILRFDGKLQPYVYEATGDPTEPVRLRPVPRGAPELACPRLPFFELKYNHQDDGRRVSALFTSRWEYNFVSNNCRHHVESFLQRMVKSKFRINNYLVARAWLLGIKVTDLILVAPRYLSALVSSSLPVPLPAAASSLPGPRAVVTPLQRRNARKIRANKPHSLSARRKYSPSANFRPFLAPTPSGFQRAPTPSNLGRARSGF